MSGEPPSSQTLSGSVERVTFHNEQNGYSVLKLRVTGRADAVTVTGNFSSVSAGESVRVTGVWTFHPQFGNQFRATDYEVARPATLAGIQKYLGSGLIKGLGPVMAKRIVDHFGTSTLDIIENEIERLVEVRGVARKRIELVQQAWAEQRSIKDVMIFLQGHGVSTYFAVKIFKQYGSHAIRVVEADPYRLSADIYGIGFRTADKIAQSLGMSLDAPTRLEAGLQYVLSQATDQGHCFLPQQELVARAKDILGIESELHLVTSVAHLVENGLCRQEVLEVDNAIYLAPLWQAERSLARRFKALSSCRIRVDSSRVDDWLNRFTSSKDIQLSDEQTAAVRTAVASPGMILTGGPGTGKTTTLRALVALFRAMGKVVLLASPTGRAAQRLSEVTNEEARTIHRLLEFDPVNLKFKRNDESPLTGDVVIVDEASMLDVVLANNLLKAIGGKTQLILVGDVDQLPSVGPGNVLRDLIASGTIPVSTLTTIYRQAAESLIVQNAHRVNRNEFPVLVRPGQSKCDCYFIEEEDAPRILETMTKSIVRSIPSRFGFDSRREIQALTPMNRGIVGADNLNLVLQEELNPSGAGKAEVTRGGRTLRVGDRVIQRVNNYKLEVFNGDMGTIEFVDGLNELLVVRFADRLVSYDYGDLIELNHGFAITIHKSQGSEYPVVVVPLHMQHYIMLSRNLLYTALTRAKQLVVMIGSRRALGAAMHNVEAVRRYTGLLRELS
jgi:exodeoxyribonuclease V alpha subunit